MEPKELIKVHLQPKDSTAGFDYEVERYWQEAECLCLMFPSGRERMYPMCQIWYLEIQH